MSTGLVIYSQKLIAFLLCTASVFPLVLQQAKAKVVQCFYQVNSEQIRYLVMKQSSKAAWMSRNCIAKSTVRKSRARVAHKGSSPTLVVTISGQTHSRAALI